MQLSHIYATLVIFLFTVLPIRFLSPLWSHMRYGLFFDATVEIIFASRILTDHR